MSDALPESLSGKSIGQYEIVSFLGAGGMGEVYRARDSRLGRDVAIKMLLLERGADPDRLRRFALEAQTTGRINHPNVVSVFDAGEWEGRPFIVTELLEGETLRAYLQSSGPLPVRKVIEFGIQLARGLAAAHERGIIHRDLKPANIFVTRDGHLKILDFGLAKLGRSEWESSARDSDTISMLSTPGAVLGSAGYMSPEQVEARPADHRADIFSLGAIVYEMLAGRRAFSGSSAVATMSAILKDQPPEITVVRPGVPAALAAIVRRCLEKRPEDRYQSARDLAFTMEELTARSDITFSSAAMAALRSAAGQVRARPVLSVTTVAVLLLVALVVGTIDSKSAADAVPARPERRPARWEIERITSSGLAGDYLSMSGDAKYVVHDSGSGLTLIHLPTRSATVIVKGTLGELFAPRFTPDGNFIYFGRHMADGPPALYRVPLLGGDPELVLRHFADRSSVTFAPDGSRFAFIRDDETKDESALVVAASDGSGERTVARRSWNTSSFMECAWSPDAGRFLCTVFEKSKPAMLEVDAVTGRQTLRPAMKVLRAARWLPDGKAVAGVSDDGQIWLVQTDTLRAERITNDVASYRAFSVSRDGQAVAAIRMDITTNLWAVSTADGRLRQITTGVNTFDGNWGVARTPDGRIVWASRASGTGTHLMISNLDGSGRRQLTFGDVVDWWPNVSRDGRSIVFQRQSDDGFHIWRMDADGANARLLAKGGQAHFTADGNAIVFQSGEEVYSMPAGGGEPRSLGIRTLTGPKPSPDGKSLLVSSNESSRVVPIAGPGPVRELPDVPPAHRRWSPDGRAIAYLKGARDGSLNLYVRDLSGSSSLQLTRFTSGEQVAWGFDWTPDGKEIVFARRNQTRDVVLLEAVR